MKIGVTWGNPETTPGGMALKFYSSLRIELKRIGQLKHGEEIIGNRVKAKIVKNKVAPPFKVVEYDIYYNEGISQFSDVINTGMSLEVIKKSGTTIMFGEQKLGVGMEQSKQFLRDNPDVLENIKKELKVKIDSTFDDSNA
jgi:recombination protein RecA